MLVSAAPLSESIFLQAIQHPSQLYWLNFFAFSDRLNYFFSLRLRMDYRGVAVVISVYHIPFHFLGYYKRFESVRTFVEQRFSGECIYRSTVVTLDLGSHKNEVQWNCCYLGVDYTDILFPAFTSADADLQSYLLLKKLAMSGIVPLNSCKCFKTHVFHTSRPA